MPRGPRHHLVVVRRPYLDLILSGVKRVECRLSRLRRPPFEAIAVGDLLWLKPPSHPIQALATAGRCVFHQLRQPAELADIVRDYGEMIRAEPDFFRDAARWAKYVSLIWIDTVFAITPLPFQKSDQRAWVVLDEMPRPAGERRSLRESASRPSRAGPRRPNPIPTTYGV